MAAYSRPPLRLDGRPVAAIFRSAVFNPSESFVRAHAAGLVRYRPLVVGLEAKGDAVPELEGRILLPRGRAERLACRLFGRTDLLADRVAPANPRLLHAHFGTDGLLALPLARALGVPLVTSLHGYDVSRTRAAMLASGRVSWMRYALRARRLTAEGALFLAVSEAVRARALARGYPPDRTLTHYLGVDLARFRPPEASPEAGLILHVGRLVEKKGTALLLGAFAEVRKSRPDASLAIVGEGPLERRLRMQAASLGLGDSVRFLGALPHEVVASWMRRAWVLAAPSLAAADGDSEGLPTVVVEAAASGLPVIGSDHAGIPEAVADGRTGFIVPEGDASALASALVGILQSQALRGAMSAAARALAEEHFDSRRQIAALERHYDRILANPA